ncbi:MAG TPA: allantoate amidohydrolase [Verrucomicrobiae bacterium]|nr:allantoate amidohydrolase [Verrucomicrobiae bacterium]
MGLLDLSRQLMRRCDELGAISEEPGRLTRTFASPAMGRANKLVGTWMREAGLQVREDAAFNLLGRWNSTERGAKTFLMGSHLDTVRDAGKYDGPLGVLTAIAAVQLLQERGVKLPFNLEIAGFSDEEGVRYQTTYLGSRAMIGTLTAADMARITEKQIVKARRPRDEFFGYAEVHIEQGPVLEKHNLPVGVVTAIAGQSRLRVEFHGIAGHAGTVPMNLRQDALAGAAELVLAAERCGVLGTVGKLEVAPGASNVIPGHVALTLDVRSQNDSRRVAAVKRLHVKAKTIAKARGLKLTWTPVQESAAVQCDKSLAQLFSQCVAQQGLKVLKLPSGAGHDGVALSAVCPVAMLFIRCKGGVSHNPAEAIKAADAQMGVAVLADFIVKLGGVAKIE